MKFKLFSSLSLVLFLVLVFSISIFILNPKWDIAGDGHGYYMYLRSLAFDGDFDFTNEYIRYHGIYGTDLSNQATTSIGKHGNPFAIGMSILLSPFFIPAILLDFFSGFAQFGLLGFSIYYQLFLSFGSIFYVLLGAVFLFKALQSFFSSLSSWLSVIVVIFCSPLLHYVIYEPMMSHGLSFFACCLLFWYSVVFLKKEKIDSKTLIFLGLSIGLTVLVRWQNIIFVLFPAIIYLKKIQERKIITSKVFISPLVVLLILLPQFLMWKFLYGSFFLVPQGSGFIQFLQPKILSVLFSGYHGLFSWHPFLLVGVLGLILAFRKNKFLVTAMSIMLFVQVYLNASLLDWWGGSAFGARKMIGSLFIFAFGFAYLFDRVDKSKVKAIVYLGIIFIFFVWNYLLLIASPRGFLPLGEPVSIKQLYSAPFVLLR